MKKKLQVLEMALKTIGTNWHIRLLILYITRKMSTDLNT